jgi:hypothetical protein
VRVLVVVLVLDLWASAAKSNPIPPAMILFDRSDDKTSAIWRKFAKL